MRIKTLNITGKSCPRHHGKQEGVRTATVRFTYEVTVAGEDPAQRRHLEAAAQRALGDYLSPRQKLKPPPVPKQKAAYVAPRPKSATTTKPTPAPGAVTETKG